MAVIQHRKKHRQRRSFVLVQFACFAFFSTSQKRKMQFRPEKRRVQPRKPGPPPHQPETPFAATTPLFRASNRETDETYGGVIAVLNPKLRVVAGSCGLQWVIQKRKNQLMWTSFAYCGTREGLLLRIRSYLQTQSGAKHTLPLTSLVARYVDPAAWAIIEGLPDYFDSGGKKPPVTGEIRPGDEAAATPIAAAPVNSLKTLYRGRADA